MTSALVALLDDGLSGALLIASVMLGASVSLYAIHFLTVTVLGHKK